MANSLNCSTPSFSASGDAQHKQEDDVHMKYVQTLEKIRCLFNHEQSLSLIDVIQRLGLGHHFSKEIEAVLRHHHCSYFSHEKCIPSNELYIVSLSFRQLRQAGLPITQDIFASFMNDNGEKKFKKDLREDTKGLLALYEASHLGFEGEDILKEAARFSTCSLYANMVEMHDERQRSVIQYTLKNPCHITMARFIVAKDFIIENYVSENERATLLQDLVRIERSMIGSLFQQEVVQVVKWWNGLDLMKGLESARDQPIKWHMWSMFVLLNPSMSWQRQLLTKPVSLVYIVDDIFDLYGTLDQLNLFTQTIKRWEFCETDEGLPSYMRMCVNAVIETTQEISHIIHQKHGFNPLDILKRSWKKLFDAFLIEAKWFASGSLPKADEYLKNGIVSSGVPMALSHLFFILGDNILNREIQEMLNEDHDSITYLVGMILRLYDDLGDAQDKEQNGHDGSYLNCYMKEFEITSYEAGKEHVMNMVSETWRKLNECSLSCSNPFPPNFTEACLNVVRMVPIMYDKGRKDELDALKEYLPLKNPW